MVIREDWRGLVGSRRCSGAQVTLRAPLRPGSQGGSGAFLGLGDDNKHYWIKTLNNSQGKPRVVINEQIVGRVGALIGGSLCEVRTIMVPDALAGWEFRPGFCLEAGIAHGSLAIDGCVETRALGHRPDDDNGVRHAYILGVFDWCWGQDPQWLIAEVDDHRYYSHDHGHYFPGGPDWQSADLEGSVDAVNEFPDSGDGIGAEAVDMVATRLDAVTRASLVDVLTMLPKEWPVSDVELEVMGFFLERRAGQAAQRLRQRFGRIL